MAATRIAGLRQRCVRLRGCPPKKKFEAGAYVRVLESSKDSYAPPHAVAAPHIEYDTNIYNTTLLDHRKNPLSRSCMTMATWQSNLTRWKATLARWRSRAW